VIENWKVEKKPGNENTRDEVLCLQFYEQQTFEDLEDRGSYGATQPKNTEG